MKITTNIASDTLKYIGVKPSLKGFDYLVYAIANYRDENCSMESIYRTISRYYNVSRASIERNARHAITNCFHHTMTNKVWTEVFSNTIDTDRGCPKLKEFIACVVDYLERKEVK